MDDVLTTCQNNKKVKPIFNKRTSIFFSKKGNPKFFGFFFYQQKKHLKLAIQYFF